MWQELNIVCGRYEMRIDKRKAKALITGGKNEMLGTMRKRK